MIEVWFGEDRMGIAKEVKKVFAGEYEVFAGEEMGLSELRDALLGRSFLAEERKVLIKGLAENKVVWEGLAEIVAERGVMGTRNAVVIWEEKLDKRTRTYKELGKAGVRMREFKLVDKEAEQNAKMVFEILDVAMRDGKRAVAMLEKIELNQDPYMLVGLFATQALKKYASRQGVREKRLMRELAKLDMEMKSSAIEPWTLVKAFLLKI